MPPLSVDTVEIGNEPDLYAKTGWRPASYTMLDYMTEFDAFSNGIYPFLPSTTKLLGPSFASPTALNANIDTFVQQHATDISIVSHHSYAVFQDTGETISIDCLLQPSKSSNGPLTVKSAVEIAHKHNLLFRIGEINSIDHGGIKGISDGFSSALWAIDTMFEYANVGVDGVNWHGLSGNDHSIFSFGVNQGTSGKVFTLSRVNPLYYGLLLFRLATAHDCALLPVATDSGPNLKVWATVDQNETVHVVIINKDKSFGGDVVISVAGYGDGQVFRLVAPRYESSTGVSFGGQTFDGSIDGRLAGPATSELVKVSNGTYKIPVQPISAVLLTLDSPAPRI